MKKILFRIFLVTLAVSGICSCDVALEKYKLAPESEYVAAVLDTPSDLEITADNSKDKTVFSWKAANFGPNTQNWYHLYLTVNGNEAGIADVFTTTAEVKNSDINNILVGTFGLTPGEPATVSAYVTAEVYSLYGSLSGDPVTSNTVTFNVTPYDI